jgi:4-amino-4-deoxy-L-arabinose transferase-like glycosyltransferase
MIAKLQSTIEQYHQRIAVVICTLVLMIGVAYSIFLGNQLSFGDEFEYIKLATNLVKKHAYTLDGIHLTSYRPVGYPALLSVFVWAGLGIVHMRILNFVFLSGCVMMLYSVIRMMYGNLAGTIASVLVCAYPLLFYISSVLVPQVFGAFLLLLIVKLVLTETWNPLGRYFVAGLIWGVQILAVPSFIFALPLFAAWPMWTSRSARSIVAAAAFVIGAAVVVGPWTARNYQVFSKFVLVSTNGGWNLLLGNNELTTSNVGANVVPKIHEGLRQGMDEAQQDSLYSQMAVDFITHNKMQSVKMYFLKLANHFYVADRFFGGVEISSLQYYVLLCTSGPLLLLACIRLLMLRRVRLQSGELLLLAIYIGSALFFSIYFTRIRFRIPFDLLLMGVDAILLAFLVREGSVLSNGLKGNNFFAKVLKLFH